MKAAAILLSTLGSDKSVTVVSRCSQQVPKRVKMADPLMTPTYLFSQILPWLYYTSMLQAAHVLRISSRSVIRGLEILLTITFVLNGMVATFFIENFSFFTIKKLRKSTNRNLNNLFFCQFPTLPRSDIELLRARWKCVYSSPFILFLETLSPFLLKKSRVKTVTCFLSDLLPLCFLLSKWD